MIKVVIPHFEIITTPAIALPAIIIAKLKTAGVPVLGTLVFGGIKSGLLTWVDGLGESTYVWSPE